MREYLQTYCKRSTEPTKPGELLSPQGEGWKLHSWQLDPSKNSDYLVLVWERETPR